MLVRCGKMELNIFLKYFLVQMKFIGHLCLLSILNVARDHFMQVLPLLLYSSSCCIKVGNLKGRSCSTKAGLNASQMQKDGLKRFLQYFLSTNENLDNFNTYCKCVLCSF